MRRSVRGGPSRACGGPAGRPLERSADGSRTGRSIVASEIGRRRTCIARTRARIRSPRHARAAAASRRAIEPYAIHVMRALPRYVDRPCTRLPGTSRSQPQFSRPISKNVSLPSRAINLNCGCRKSALLAEGSRLTCSRAKARQAQRPWSSFCRDARPSFAYTL